MNPRLTALAHAGVSIWLDDLSRGRLASGNLAALIADHAVVGVTTNPTIFAAALSQGADYAAQLAELGDVSTGEAIKQLCATDVRDACDLFADIYASSNGFDGRVSIEVEPGLALDADATIAQAAELHALVDRENVLIKIPATLEGLAAIEETIAAGISVNVTLIFSEERYRQVMDAYLNGLERADAEGVDLKTIHSVASFFISRVDSEIDARLTALGRADLKGQAGVANALVAYGAYEEVFGSDRFAALAARGANVQRPLWASTGTKDPSYPDTLYVTGLIADGVVNTMPEKTLLAFADHGEVVPTIAGRAAEGQALLDEITAAGVDLDAVFVQLETEGVDKFIASWDELVDSVQDAQAAVVARPAAHQVLVDFVPTKKFFVGIDSDGCAMDAMDIKHLECFTPAYIKAWDLQPISTLARETAVFVNLGSITRGLNRWLALKQLLDLLRDRVDVAERGVTIPEYPELTAFIESDFPLSDKGIAAFAEEYPSLTVDRMIAWGNDVNARIADMVHGCGPFPGVRESMQAMQADVDCMTVSATPLHALEYEWNAHGIAQYMKVIAGQEMGSKAEHVEYAAKGKYDDANILLIGDAPGDRDAAAKVDCLYYPILPGEEKRSWYRFKDEALGKFLDGTFAGEYQQMLIDEFNAKLPGEVPWPTISGTRAVTMPSVK